MVSSSPSRRSGVFLILIGMLLVIPDFFLPFQNANAIQDNLVQVLHEPMIALLLLAIVALLISGSLALFRAVPVILGAGIIAAGVGGLAGLYLLLLVYSYAGGTFTHLPEASTIPGFILLCIPLLGFLLSGRGLILLTHLSPIHPHRNIWLIGRRELLAMLIGLLIYSLVSNVYFLWEVPGQAGNIEIVLPAIVLALLFGIIYGPWVGLVTAGVGSILNNVVGNLGHIPYWVISNYWALNKMQLTTYRYPLSWPSILPYALIGFIAGLPLLTSVKRAFTVRTISKLTVQAALVTLISLSLTDILSSGSLSKLAIPLSYLQGKLTHTTIPTMIFVVVALPSALIIYRALSSSRATKEVHSHPQARPTFLK